jgi:hypothetical protein
LSLTKKAMANRQWRKLEFWWRKKLIHSAATCQ